MKRYFNISVKRREYSGTKTMEKISTFEDLSKSAIYARTTATTAE